jgi:SAM-dependent methyltransferase
VDDAKYSARAGATVGASDIARLAKVGRAAVSNWRRRFADFPEPVGGSAASPLYSLAEVESWFANHGRQYTLAPGDLVWQRLRGAVDELRLADLIGYAGAFLIFLRRDARRWRTLARRSDAALTEALSGAIRAAVPELPDALPDRPDADWVGVLRLIAEAASAGDAHGAGLAGGAAARGARPRNGAGAARGAGGTGHRELFDFVCERYLELASRRVPATPKPFAELMVSIGGSGWDSVLDPACGTGTLLLIAQQRGAASLLGQEINPSGALLTAARLLLRDANSRVVAGDSLRADGFAGERADLVVCNPPFGERSWGYDELAGDPRWEYGLPPRGEPELAWVQHCLAHARPGGLIVVMMPNVAAVRRSGRRIRGNLLRAGALRAVISLPGGGGTATGAAPDLWILRRPALDQPPASHVLMFDAADDPAVAKRAWRSFDRDPLGVLPGRGRPVRIIDLLDDEIDVSPAHRLAGAGTVPGIARFAPTHADLRAAAAGLAADLPELTAATAPAAPPMTTVGELAKAGVVAVHQAPLRMMTDGGDTPALTANDIRHGRPASGRAAAGPGTVMVMPGDVVALLADRHPIARVVEVGDCLLGPQMVLLRPDPDRLDPHFLAGYLRASQEASARGASLPPRTDVRRLTIPLLSLADQRRFGEAFRRLARFADDLARTAALGERFVQLGFAGLADGSLTPPASEQPDA